MKDQDRVIAFEKLEKSLRMLDDIEKKNQRDNENYYSYGDELIKLSEDARVKRYLFLLNERDRLKEVIRRNEHYRRPYDYEEFFKILERKNIDEISECEHSIWMVQRSFCKYGENYLIRSNNDPNCFRKSYVCIECGYELTLDGKECEIFEKENLVILNLLNYKLYEIREVYYNLLLENSSTLAIQKLYKKFK